MGNLEFGNTSPSSREEESTRESTSHRRNRRSSILEAAGQVEAGEEAPTAVDASRRGEGTHRLSWLISRRGRRRRRQGDSRPPTAGASRSRAEVETARRGHSRIGAVAEGSEQYSQSVKQTRATTGAWAETERLRSTEAAVWQGTSRDSGAPRGHTALRYGSDIPRGGVRRQKCDATLVQRLRESSGERSYS